jgi:3-dehydroquinate synthase
VAFVYDERVAALARRVAQRSARSGRKVLGHLGIRGGERCKSAEVVARLWRWLHASGADRHSVLVAVGGGTVGDVVGFAAATFMRGIRWMPVPTTLLAMVDAAIGGKTAIDLREGKNLAGAFWPPIAVVADLDSLATLPPRQIQTGVAEIVKAAIVGDPRLLEILATLRGRRIKPTAWLPIVAAAAAVKARVVASDPREQGERAALNLGHTLGHAIEHAARGRLEHGEAVAIGLRGEGLLAIRAGLFSPAEHARMLNSLEGWGLPLAHGGLDPTAIARSLRGDKKRRDGVVRFALPERIGAVRIGVAVNDADVRAVIRQCARPPGAEELRK